MAIIKPALGSTGWGHTLNAALDALDGRATASQTAAAASAAAAAASAELAQDISGIDTPDALVATLVSDPDSDTGTALSATLGEQLDTEGTPARDAVARSFKPSRGDVGRGGRGMISIVYDDGQPAQFSELLPISIKMGFPVGVAWVTGNGLDTEVAAAHAAGWEILSHTVNHDNMTTFTEAQLIADAEASLSAIEAITGTRQDVAFVYPEHQRNTFTDRILSRYYTWGRGIADYAQGHASGHPWLVAEHTFNTEYAADGSLSERFKEILQAVARNDGRLGLYSHYTDESVNVGGRQSLITLVEYARSLGIQIVRPSDLRGATNLANTRRTPYQPSEWILGSANWSISSEQAIRDGENSFKFTPNGEGGWYAHGRLNTDGLLAQPHYATPGCFTVVRASFRYKATADVATAAGWGLALGAILNSRPVNGGDLTNEGAHELASKFPATGATIPAADWGLVARTIALGPDVASFVPYLEAANIAETTSPFYVTDIKFDRLDVVSALSYTATLNGTTGVTIDTAVLGVSGYAVTVTPRGAVAGRLYTEFPTHSQVVVKSTDAADTTQQVQVTIHPTIGYKDYTLNASGA